MLNGEPYEINNLPLVRAMKKGQTIREEFIVKHQDGSEHICDAIASPVYEKDKIICCMVIFIDITEQKKAKAALQKAHNQLEQRVNDRTLELKKANESLRKNEIENITMLNDLLTGFVVHSADSSVIFSNKKATEILGLTNEQMTGKKAVDPAWNFVNENSLIMQIEDYPVSKVLSTKRPYYDLVAGIKRPDQKYITWVIVNAIPVFSQDNIIEKVAVNFLDITERKQAEIALSQETERLLVTLRSIGDGVITTDTKGRVTLINKIGETLTGWTQAEASGKDIKEVFNIITPAIKYINQAA